MIQLLKINILVENDMPPDRVGNGLKHFSALSSNDEVFERSLIDIGDFALLSLPEVRVLKYSLIVVGEMRATARTDLERGDEEAS